jgi:hypothetical protein
MEKFSLSVGEQREHGRSCLHICEAVGSYIFPVFDCFVTLDV